MSVEEINFFIQVGIQKKEGKKFTLLFYIVEIILLLL